MDNPIRYEDKEGDCPLCIVVAAVLWLASEPVTAPTLNTKADNVAVQKAWEQHDTQVAKGIQMAGTIPTTIISTAASAANKNNGNKVQKDVKTFGGKQSTTSSTSKEAFGKAKEANGIPRSKQPDKTIKQGTTEGDKAGLDSRNVKQYEFTNSKGEKVIIRQDKPAKYPDGGKQDPHYNAGNIKDDKLKQHHYYDNKPN